MDILSADWLCLVLEDAKVGHNVGEGLTINEAIANLNKYADHIAPEARWLSDYAQPYS